MLRCIKGSVTTIKPGHQDIRKGLRLENTQRNLQSGMPGSNSEIRGRFCDGLDSGAVFCWPHHYPSWPNPCKEYVDRFGNQVHHMTQTTQTLFPKNDAVFLDDSVPFTQLELFSHGLKSMNVNFINSLITDYLAVT
jgi:hypothetical protein